jgi:hypothetical protein
VSSTPGQRAGLAKAQDGICLECNMPLPDGLAKTEVDHIIPRARGGPDRAWNRRLVHFACNRNKRFKLTDEARALAAEHDVTLLEPKPHWYRRNENRTAVPPEGWPYPDMPRMYPRICNWCGAQVVASTDDPEIFVGCPDCDRLYDGAPPPDLARFGLAS